MRWARRDRERESEQAVSQRSSPASSPASPPSELLQKVPPLTLTRPDAADPESFVGIESDRALSESERASEQRPRERDTYCTTLYVGGTRDKGERDSSHTLFLVNSMASSQLAKRRLCWGAEVSAATGVLRIETATKACWHPRTWTMERRDDVQRQCTLRLAYLHHKSSMQPKAETRAGLYASRITLTTGSKRIQSEANWTQAESPQMGRQPRWACTRRGKDKARLQSSHSLALPSRSSSHTHRGRLTMVRTGGIRVSKLALRRPTLVQKRGICVQSPDPDRRRSAVVRKGGICVQKHDRLEPNTRSRNRLRCCRRFPVQGIRRHRALSYENARRCA